MIYKATSTLLLLLIVTTTDASVFKATIRPINGSNVRGKVTVYCNGDDSTVSYHGSVKNAEPNLYASDCGAPNGCGAHIHDGNSCGSASSQGGHLYESPVTSDPWVVKRYQSNGSGRGYFGDGFAIGTNDLQGKPFIIHAADGSRIGCGILKKQ